MCLFENDDYKKTNVFSELNNLDKNFVSIPILLEYQDINENKYTKEVSLSFDVYTSKELGKYGLKKRNNKVLVTILIILGIIAYYFYKKKKK